MQDRRGPRPQTPRNDMRRGRDASCNSFMSSRSANDYRVPSSFRLISSERESGSPTPRRYQTRPNSAKVADRISARRNLLSGKNRSNSARVKPEEPEPVVESSDQEQCTPHKTGCPWLKARSRSKYAVGVSESSSGIMHPKPWGARNPRDIPCFCYMTKNSKENQQVHNRQHKIHPSDIPNKTSKAKINDMVNSFGIFLERRKVHIAENEIPFVLKKIEEKLLKFVDKPKQEHKEQAKSNKSVRNHSPVPRQHTTMPTKAVSRDQLMDLQKGKIPGQQNILGKLETKKYLLELTADEPVPPNFRNILGTMNPTIIHPHSDKMLIAMDEKQQPYLAIPEDYRHYSMKTIDMDNYTGVVHHQAENTTLLLATNPALARRSLHSPPQSLMQKPHLASHYKQVRRS